MPLTVALNLGSVAMVFAVLRPGSFREILRMLELSERGECGRNESPLPLFVAYVACFKARRLCIYCDLTTYEWRENLNWRM